MAFARRPNREPIADQAYSAVKRKILDLTFKPGELLSETRLAAEFGLSRTPVREALKRLVADGLVDIIPQHGTFVSPIRRESVMDAQFAREALECAIVRDAAILRSEASIRELDGNLRQQKEAVCQSDYNTLYRLDDAMHEMLTQMAGRPSIWPLVADIKVHMDRARQLTLRPDHAPRIIDQHKVIVEAVRAGDSSAAAAAMSKHLRFVIEHFDDFIAANQSYTVEVQRTIA